MIGPRVLLLVIHHLFAVPVSNLLSQVTKKGNKKSKQLNSDVKIIFAKSHTEHCWRCSMMPKYGVWVKMLLRQVA